MGNGSGDHPPDFDAFDALPPEIREVLRYAPRNFAPASVAESFARYGGRRKIGAYVAHMRAVIGRRFGVNVERDRGY